METKLCPSCKKSLPTSDFYTNKSKANRLSSECKPCFRARMSRRPQTSRPKRDRDRQLKAKFGISLLEYDRVLAEQRGVCAICGLAPDKKRLAVDHDHTTGAIRGLLCFSCNTGLGKFRDSITLLEKSVQYLLASGRKSN